mgnify:CR=1 FL=1
MAYSSMSVEEMIVLAAEFVGTGLDIPREIRDELSPDLLWDIEHPETTQNDDN